MLGLEPRITESKSVVLPLHYTPTSGGDGGIRAPNLLRMKQMHYRYATSPYLVGPTGIEPVSTVLQTAAMTTSAKVPNLVPQQRIELRIDAYKATVIPFNY